jgi:hypothetical protein
MNEWFEGWFNTAEYVNVYRHRSEAEAELLIELILKSVSIPSTSGVLNLACSAGRQSILFAERGFKDFIESVSLYNPDELKKCIVETGFEITNIFGNYYEDPFDSETSSRIIIARK